MCVVRTIFTGSSREGLQKMFGDAKAPFFHFGGQIILADLGDDFVDHMLKRAETIADVRVDPQEALATFEALQRSPYHFRNVVGQLVLNPDLYVGAALAAYRERQADEQGYARRWLSLKPAPRAILSAVAKGDAKVYSQDVIKQISAAVGQKVPRSSVQRAVSQLVGDGVLDRWDGGLVFADNEFRLWVLSQK